MSSGGVAPRHGSRVSQHLEHWMTISHPASARGQPGAAAGRAAGPRSRVEPDLADQQAAAVDRRSWPTLFAAICSTSRPSVVDLLHNSRRGRRGAVARQRPHRPAVRPWLYEAAPESTGASPRSTGDLTLGHSAPTTRPPHGAPGSQGGRLRATRRVRSSDGRGLGGGDSGAPPSAGATFCRRKDFQPRTDPRPSAPTSPSRREGSSSRRGRNKDPQA